MEIIQYKLEKFEGPLDLLLQLISKNKMNIFDVCIENLVDQYIEHIKNMDSSGMDLSSEFLEMASRLVYIKTVSLLPHSEEAEKLKSELKGQLIEYKKCKEMAVVFGQLVSFDLFCKERDVLKKVVTPYERKHDVMLLCDAYADVLMASENRLQDGDAEKPFGTIVKRKVVSVQSRIVFLLGELWESKEIFYDELFLNGSERSELVATFLAVLELIKENRIEVVEYGDTIKLRLIVGGEVKLGIEQKAGSY